MKLFCGTRGKSVPMFHNHSPKSLFSFIWSFILSQKTLFFFIFLVSLAWSLDMTIWPFILRNIIDILNQYESNRSLALDALLYPIIGGVSLWTLVEVGFRTQGFLLAKALPRLEADIRLKMFDHIQRHSPKYFNEHFSGSFANKITDMTTQVSSMLEEILTVFIPSIVGAFLAIGFYVEVKPLFASILGIWILIHFGICIFFSRKCDLYEHIHGEVRSALLGKIVDSFTNNFAVNVFYRFPFEKKLISRFQKLEQEKNEEAKFYSAKMRVYLGLFGFLIGAVGINGLMLYFWIQGNITTGEIVQIFNMTSNIMVMMWFASMSIPFLYQSIGLAKQALTVMQHPQDIIDVMGAKPLIVKKGSISFENVSFYYGHKSVFKEKNVEIKGGEKIGLIGYSGAGKSTFIHLIMRFYSVTEGKILIDGKDISEVTLESLRKQIALIPQEPILFHRSIRENIAYGNPQATEEAIIQAAKIAHCHEFILRTSEGYDTLLGERGTKLSGGERQRIALARAILADAPILILDEATSALDSVTEQLIQESLSYMMKNKTSLVIAHRLSTLSRMDRILVFGEGKILEEGSHETLMKKNGHYKHMWETQAFGFLPDKPS